nr:uncharacterized protein LOC111504859 [Leptinotarsa decemlineata]
MQIFFLLLTWTCAVLFTQKASGSPPGPIHAPLDIISLEDITPEERKEIAYFEQKLGRPKRSGSGSGDILNALKNAIGQGIKRKVGQIAKASASASGHFSSSSSSSGGGGHSYLPPEHAHESYDDHKSVDFWTLKKSILNTLLQAVKAIKGGVIAVKGQLIKGSGKLLSAKGKLISYKGDAITKLGKNIATSAILVPYNGHHSAGHEDTHYSAPSAPEEIYDGPPSASGPEYHDYHVPYNYPPPHHEGADGLLIVKKIPSGHHHQHVENVPAFKPLKPSGPGLGTIVSKFFAASSSSNPHQPEPFGNTASAGTYYNSYEPESNYHYDDPWDNKVAPSAASGLVTLGEKHAISQQKPVHPTTSYGEPFEKAPSYLSQNLDDFSTAASHNSPKLIQSNIQKNNAFASSTSVGSGKTISQNGFGSPQDSNFITSNNTPPFDESLSSSQGFGFSFLDNSSDDQYSLNSGLRVEQLQPTSDQVSFQNDIQSPTDNSYPASSSYLSLSKGSQLPNIADYPDGFPGHVGIKVEEFSNHLHRQYYQHFDPYFD